MAVSIQTKTDPVGIDIKIQNLQNRFAKVMISKWSLTNGSFFGRVYLDDSDEFVVPSNYKSTREYRQTLFNDKIPVSSFFYVKNETQIGVNFYSATVSHIWQFKADELKPSILHMADEELQVEEGGKKKPGDKVITGERTGL